MKVFDWLEGLMAPLGSDVRWFIIGATVFAPVIAVTWWMR